MNRNTLYLVGCWTVAIGLFGGWFTAMIVVGLLQQDWVKAHALVLVPVVGFLLVPFPVVVVICGFGVRLLLIMRKGRKLNQQMRRSLQSPTSDDLIAFYQNLAIAGSPLVQSAIRAQLCATVYALYGEFDAARSQLKRVDWEKVETLFRAGGRVVEALLCYLDTRTYEEGLACAREAQELAATPSETRSLARVASRWLDEEIASYVEIGEILNGQFTAATVTSLEAKRERQRGGLAFLVVDWGLSVAYDKMKDSERADSTRARILEAAPYCLPILRAHN
jgi:hypothetical protein